ncbi:four-helix bundle copper-binding protein [Thermosediminibacter oceani]|uniref:four-helix bundle copper-binding protein n=1 Tax=Thermosediminibacter oceani TaxID=291990 RepID=UPI0009FF5818
MIFVLAFAKKDCRQLLCRQSEAPILGAYFLTQKNACARECKMFKDAHCQQCADTCRQCAQECKNLANM